MNNLEPVKSNWICPSCGEKWHDIQSEKHFKGVPLRGKLDDDLLVAVENLWHPGLDLEQALMNEAITDADLHALPIAKLGREA